MRGDVDVEACLAMAAAKTGALLGSACAIGALLGGGRPAQVLRSGLSSSAMVSSGVRNVTIRRSERFVGIASTRWIRPACSGCRSEQY